MSSSYIYCHKMVYGDIKAYLKHPFVIITITFNHLKIQVEGKLFNER